MSLLCSIFFVPTVAQAASGTDLPFSSLDRMAVDPIHGHEFLTGGPGTGQLAVLDEDGAMVETIALQGPSGLALVGNDLFVVEADAPDIAVIDTSATPPAVYRTIEVGSFTQLGDLTYVRQRLWFYAADGYALASVLPDGTDLSKRFFTGANYEPRFADGLSGGRDLVVAEQGICGATVQRYTATMPPVYRDSVSSPDGACGLDQMAMLPGSASLVIAADYPVRFPEVRSDDLDLTDSYTANTHPRAVATTSALGGMIAGGTDGTTADDVFAYRIGQTTAFYTYDFGTSDVTVAAGGIAWSADGQRLFVVTSGGAGNSDTFRVLLPTGLPTVATTTLSLHSSSSVVGFGQAVDVTAHLDGGTTNRDVTIYSTAVGGSRTTVGSGTVDGAGDLVLSGYVPTASSILTASYDGDSSWGPAAAIDWVDVRSRTSVTLLKSDGMHHSVFLYKAGHIVIASAQVEPALEGGSARLIVEMNRGSGWHRADALEGRYATSGAIPSWGITGPAPRTHYRLRIVSLPTLGYLMSRSPWVPYQLKT